MAENIGPKIGIEGEAAFKQSLKNIVQQTKALDAEFKMVTSTFGKNSDAQAKLKAQAEVLGRQLANQKSRVTLLETAYENSKKKLDELSAALNKATNEHGKNSTEAQAANAAYQRQIGVVAKAKTEWMNATTAANKMADQLADTTMDPKTRILQRVTIEDAAAAERAVRELMGNQVECRRDYIERHAKDARFLDI